MDYKIISLYWFLFVVEIVVGLMEKNVLEVLGYRSWFENWSDDLFWKCCLDRKYFL